MNLGTLWHWLGACRLSLGSPGLRTRTCAWTGGLTVIALQPGPKGRRVVHGLGPFGKSFFSGLLADGPWHHESEADHGFLRHRRREDAIAGSMCVSWRLALRRPPA